MTPTTKHQITKTTRKPYITQPKNNQTHPYQKIIGDS